MTAICAGSMAVGWASGASSLRPSSQAIPWWPWMCCLSGCSAVWPICARTSPWSRLPPPSSCSPPPWGRVTGKGTLSPGKTREGAQPSVPTQGPALAACGGARPLGLAPCSFCGPIAPGCPSAGGSRGVPGTVAAGGGPPSGGPRHRLVANMQTCESPEGTAACAAAWTSTRAGSEGTAAGASACAASGTAAA